VLRSEAFEVAAMPRQAVDTARLPRHVAPDDGEALISWIAQLGADLAMSPLALGRDAFGVDARTDPEWWRRPEAETLMRIDRRTGIDIIRLKAMTLIGWASALDDEDADRFAARRWRSTAASQRRGRRIDICLRCVAEAARPNIQIIWMLGWAGVCPRHRAVLTSRCPACSAILRTETLKSVKPIDLAVCRRCGTQLTDGAVRDACAATLALQEVLIAGKRCGTTLLPGMDALDWRTTIALADLLLGMVWVGGSAGRRGRLFARIAGDLDIADADQASVPWTSNYGGLLILAWILQDLPARLRAAIATLCSPRIEKLLGRIPHLDDELRDRLRAILAPAATKPPEGRRMWRAWIHHLPESAEALRGRAASERYKHRRQRLTALAALKDGASVEATATAVGVTAKSVYRWLHRGASNGLEAALERQTGNSSLTAKQAETLAQWIVCDRLNQNRRAIVAHAAELFGIAMSPDAASKLLAKHRQPKPGRRRRLWGPRHGPRRNTGSTHDPAPGL